MVWVWKDLKYHLIQLALHGQGIPSSGAQSRTQPVLKHFHDGESPTCTGSSGRRVGRKGAGPGRMAHVRKLRFPLSIPEGNTGKRRRSRAAATAAAARWRCRPSVPRGAPGLGRSRPGPRVSGHPRWTARDPDTRDGQRGTPGDTPETPRTPALPLCAPSPPQPSVCPGASAKPAALAPGRAVGSFPGKPLSEFRLNK